MLESVPQFAVNQRRGVANRELLAKVRCPRTMPSGNDGRGRCALSWRYPNQSPLAIANSNYGDSFPKHTNCAAIFQEAVAPADVPFVWLAGAIGSDRALGKATLIGRNVPDDCVNKGSTAGASASSTIAANLSASAETSPQDQVAKRPRYLRRHRDPNQTPLNISKR
ncbi:hypothetical protein RQX22_09250 [Sphingosinicella sp. GR2756]|uniref:Uncharacterized protein n=1 Tax=Sphingosinicella rhizophila TaxID=3050082 RepID=A0ABU3Q6V5_9SPHN|nr:hypothetical protein [Sphingosinicella sp. GR2756]